MTVAITSWLIILTTVALSLYTLGMSLNTRDGDTISETIRRWAASHPFVPFALGSLCGHWLAPAVASPSWGLFSLAGCGAGLLAGSLARPLRLSMWQAMCVFAAGIIAGGLLWSQPTP